jgi:hypothetical protein
VHQVSGITVIVVPTWAVWLFVGFAVVNLAQHIWKIALLRKQARHEPPNVEVSRQAGRGEA